MKISVRNFALGTSFLAMGIIIVLDLNYITLNRDQLIHAFMAWLIVNLVFILIKILTHE